MLDSRGGEAWGQSHFPDCLVLMEGGRSIDKDDSSLQMFPLTLSLSFSVATVGDGDGKKKGAQQ